MNNVKVTFNDKDLNKLFQNLNKFSKEAQKKVKATLLEGGFAIHEDISRAIQTPSGGGKAYKRGNRIHRASAPGSAPNTDTGFLVNSNKVRKANQGLTVYVYNTAKYSVWLEKGTSRVAPRPFYKPSYDKFIPRITKAVAKDLKA